MNFENTAKAFKLKTTKELKLSCFLFWLMSKPKLVKYLSVMTNALLKFRFPIKWVIKGTIYKQFCGGEDRSEFERVILELGKSNIGTILDYSVEGEDSDEDFEKTKNELIKIVKISAGNQDIPVACMKMTGIASIKAMEELQVNGVKTEDQRYVKIKKRLNEVCSVAASINTPIYIDAEETWIQNTIDSLCEEMMVKYNGEKAIVFTTLQMYRHDRLDYFKQLHCKMQKANVKTGVKIVRGAYLEKENELAKSLDLNSPIHVSKEATDQNYNAALKYAVDNVNSIELCAGTHNEDSCHLLIELMMKHQLKNDHSSIWFSQLFGMSDHISYNLANENYNVSKYLPYGPVRSTMPYLIRRAEENTAISGQMSQELQILKKELKRRKLSSND